MRRAALCWTALLILAAALGCASQRAQLATAADTYATTLNVLADARRAGLIDDQQAAEIERWRVVARAALDAWLRSGRFQAIQRLALGAPAGLSEQ